MSGRRGSNPAIYFLSDYGIADEFVGVVHAVLHRLAPTSTVIDLSHLVAPFDVQAGADLLERSLPHLGPGVVLAVVDPGVGTARRAVAVAVESVDGPQWLVGPDNGILLPAADALGPVTRAVGLEARALAIGRTASPGPAGATFDGRDLFAPAAAHLAQQGRDQVDQAGALEVGHDHIGAAHAPTLRAGRHRAGRRPVVGRAGPPPQ